MDNKSKKYDYLIFIGRFQPFHLGHQQVVTQALDISERLIVLVGSAERPRCTRNPWTYVEREMMIRESLADVLHRITIKPLPDATYDEATWQSFVQSQVKAVLETDGVCETETRIGLIGHAKDATSYYVKSFPQWPFQEVGNATGICATSIREQFLSGGGLAELLLGPQGWDSARIQDVLDSGKLTNVVLETPMPVLLTYLTARVNDDGTLLFFPDVYERDAAIAAGLEEPFSFKPPEQ